MQYNGKELVEYKSDTPQFWPEGKEMLVPDGDSGIPKKCIVRMYDPNAISPFVASPIDGYWQTHFRAYVIRTNTKRRVTRKECAGMAVKHRDGALMDGQWTPCYIGWNTEEQWNEPMPEHFIDRALTLADALAGRTLGMEVEE